MAERSYEMKARARAVEATRVRIMQATIDLFLQGGLEGISLEGAARGAGVTVQTVLRHFGSKEGLFATTVEQTRERVLRAREVPRGASMGEALGILLGMYEQYGELNWQLLRQEAREPAVAELLREARQVHRQWLAEVFDALLPARGAERERRLDLLFAATDFYVWKLYRRDLAFSRRRTEQRMRQALEMLCTSFSNQEAP